MKALQNISFDERDAVKNLFVDYRIRGDDLIPQTITTELDVQPTVSCQKGEKYVGKKYDPVAMEKLCHFVEVSFIATIDNE